MGSLRELVANTFAMWCRGLVQHADNLKVLVLLWSWSAHAGSQAIVTNDLVLCLHYLGCTKSNTKVRNQLTSQPITIVVGTNWAMKRNMSVVNDQYI